VSPVTVSRALAQLAAEGLVVTRPAPARSGPGPVRDRRRGDTSWQEVALSADGAADFVPRTVDASAVLATLASAAGVIEFNGGYLHPSCSPSGRWRRPCPGRARPVPGAAADEAAGAARVVRAQHRRGVTAAEVLVSAGRPDRAHHGVRALAPPGAPSSSNPHLSRHVGDCQGGGPAPGPCR